MAGRYERHGRTWQADMSQSPDLGKEVLFLSQLCLKLLYERLVTLLQHQLHCT